MNLSFNALTGVNSLCSIYFTNDTKKKFPLNLSNSSGTVKLHYLTEIDILNNFDIHG